MVFSERVCQKPLEIQADHITQVTLLHMLVDLVKKNSKMFVRQDLPLHAETMLTLLKRLFIQEAVLTLVIAPPVCLAQLIGL